VQISSGFSRRVGLSGLAGLALLAAAYWVTREPAPRIRVLWRDGTTIQQQAALEASYFLLNARDRLPEGSLAYDLLDASRSNIRRLVEDPAVADTNDIDRHLYVVEPDTDRGDERTWVAYRVPGLRGAWSRRAVILLLAIAALVGLRREWRLLTCKTVAGMRSVAHVWNTHRRSPAGSRDFFDAIPWRAISARQPARHGALLVKLTAVALALLAAGPPVLETWETLALAAALLALVFGECRRGWWRIPAAAVLVLAAMGLKGALPRADIAEAHNAFLLPRDGGPLEEGLPPEVFASWRAQFDALYPEPEAPVSSSWRDTKAGPTTLYAKSADAIWRPAKYTRQVDAIGFRTLAEFRGGFANELRDNFWGGDLAREDMPFYVMYELTPASVGSRLRWAGQLFWERSDGRYEEIHHEQIGERTIEPDDAGKRVYAAFFPMRNPTFEFRLVPSRALRLSGWAEALLTLLGMVAGATLIRPRWPDYLRATSVCLIAYYVLIACYIEPSSARLGNGYLPHGGGNDGLVYEAHGRTMAMLAGSGRIVEALMGVESVFGSTPGTRYVRMVEKMLFGDTNHLFALMLAAIPIIVFYLMRRFIGALPAWIVTGGFLILPVQHLSFLQYFTSGRAGYADWLGAGLFLLGLTLVLYHEPGTPHRKLAQVTAAGAALAASMCIRPHVGLAVLWIGCLYVWLSWSRKDLRAALALAGGLVLVASVPVHNWYYGREFNLLTRRHATSLDQGLVARIVAEGPDGGACAVVRDQLAGWLWNPGFAYAPSSPPLQWPARSLRAVALVITAWVTVCFVRRGTLTDLMFIAGAALGAHGAMLFVFGHHQRFLLAWDLSMVVLIVWVLSRSGADVRASTAFPHGASHGRHGHAAVGAT